MTKKDTQIILRLLEEVKVVNNSRSEKILRTIKKIIGTTSKNEVVKK